MSSTHDANAAGRKLLAKIPISVRWRDMDSMGHVNNAKYISYLEEARVRWLAEIVSDWDRGSGSKPIMAAVQANYRRPLTWPGDIVVQLYCEKLGTSSITVAHRIVDARDESVLYMDGNVVMVWIDPASGRSIALPDAVRAAVRPA